MLEIKEVILQNFAISGMTCKLHELHVQYPSMKLPRKIKWRPIAAGRILTECWPFNAEIGLSDHIQMIYKSHLNRKYGNGNALFCILAPWT